MEYSQHCLVKFERPIFALNQKNKKENNNKTVFLYLFNKENSFQNIDWAALELRRHSTWTLCPECRTCWGCRCLGDPTRQELRHQPG